MNFQSCGEKVPLHICSVLFGCTLPLGHSGPIHVARGSEDWAVRNGWPGGIVTWEDAVCVAGPGPEEF